MYVTTSSTYQGGRRKHGQQTKEGQHGWYGSQWQQHSYCTSGSDWNSSQWQQHSWNSSHSEWQQHSYWTRGDSHWPGSSHWYPAYSSYNSASCNVHP